MFSCPCSTLVSITNTPSSVNLPHLFLIVLDLFGLSLGFYFYGMFSRWSSMIWYPLPYFIFLSDLECYLTQAYLTALVPDSRGVEEHMIFNSWLWYYFARIWRDWTVQLNGLQHTCCPELDSIHVCWSIIPCSTFLWWQPIHTCFSTEDLKQVRQNKYRIRKELRRNNMKDNLIHKHRCSSSPCSFTCLISISKLSA